MDSVEPMFQSEKTKSEEIQNQNTQYHFDSVLIPKIQTEAPQNRTETIPPLSNNKGIIPNTGPSTARIGSEFQAQIPNFLPQSYLATCQLNLSPPVSITYTPQNTPLPHSHPPKLSQQQKDAFLLGYYIFKKKLNFLTRFAALTVGEVLAYYYMEFYKSEGYCRVKGKKCVSGEEVFSGWRQLEVLSRLEELVAEDRREALREAFKAYNDKVTSFDSFILAIQSLSSTQALLRALSLGNRKQDLTRIRPDPTRSRKNLTCLEIPVGKQWREMSVERILGFLNGDVRLSKARSNDLFWEAIWPRLLVQGWTSYQLKDHPLVFLKPGFQIPDFSTQNLIKGFHYFDSISDLLSNIMSNPDSLKNTEIASDNNDVSNGNNDGGFSGNFVGQEMEIMMTFTIIDTSLVRDKIRSLKNLPIRGICNNSTAGQSQSDSSASLSESSGLYSSMKNELFKNKNKIKAEDKELNKPKEEEYLPPVYKKRKLVSRKKEPRNYKKSPSKKQVNQPSIDLNLDLPDLKTESEIKNQQSFRRDLDVRSDSLIITNDQKSCELDLDVYTEKERSSVENYRRHGTRNRPPTAKALEALAFGFIGTNKKKNKEILSYNSDRPKRWARKSGEKKFEGSFGHKKNAERNDLSPGLFACTEIQSDASSMKVE